MKKLFVSVPMRGRTEEEIKLVSEDEKDAEIYEGEELELIDSYIEDNPPKDSKEAVWYLGESLRSWHRLMYLSELMKHIIGMAVVLKKIQRIDMALKCI